MTRTPKRPLSHTVNGRLLDRSVRHAIALHRYGSHLTQQVVGFLNDEVFPDLLARLRARLERIRLRGYDSGVFTTGRYARMVEDIVPILDDGTKEATAMVRAAARQLAKVEAGWQRTAIENSVPRVIVPVLGDGPDLRSIATFLEHPLPHFNAPVDAVLKSLGKATAQRAITEVNKGLAIGETVDQMVQRVRGTEARAFNDGVLQGTRRQAETIVRTLVSQASTQARLETFRAMPNVVKGVQWVSTLDARTSEICMGLDGKVFDLEEETPPGPPAHPNCRSTLVAVTRSLSEILGRKAADEPDSTRASMDGQVPGKLTYGEWLEQQPAAIQDEALGRGKARLFRAGEIGVADLTTRSGRTKTLDELSAA